MIKSLEHIILRDLKKMKHSFQNWMFLVFTLGATIQLFFSPMGNLLIKIGGIAIGMMIFYSLAILLDLIDLTN